jgi:hypothetical protein
LAISSFVIGAGVIVALLFARIRQSAAALRIIGLLALFGVALHLSWLMDIRAFSATGLASLLSLIAIGAFAFCVAAWAPRRWLEAAR